MSMSIKTEKRRELQTEIVEIRQFQLLCYMKHEDLCKNVTYPTTVICIQNCKTKKYKILRKRVNKYKLKLAQLN